MTPYDTLVGKLGKAETSKRLSAFCLESNKIEGVHESGYNDLSALVLILSAKELTEQVLFDAHTDYSVGSQLTNAERGAYRTCQVFVGRYIPPKPEMVKKLMDDLLLHYKARLIATPYRLHCMFEQIHPFVDFNGRTGRAIWLRAAIEAGYDCGLGFLHKFYYQSLENFR